jgi:hypothetical protein
LCVFLWAEGLNAKGVHKEMFLFAVGSVCRVSQLGSKRFANDQEFETKVLRQHSKHFFAAVFDALVK